MTTWGLLGLLVIVIVPRSYYFRSVFRNGDVVLVANDPFLYRFTVDQIVAAMSNAFDIGVLLNYSNHVLYTRDPLFLATLSWLSELLGGTPTAVGVVVGVFPVIAGVVTVVLVYMTTCRLTGSPWAGLTAGALLAITPVHTLRTGLGYADHHAFDYIWLALTVYLLVALADRESSFESTGTRLLSVGLGIAISAQVFSWIAGPLFVIPVGLYLGIRSLYDLPAGVSPLRSNAPVLSGIGIATILVWFGRSLLDHLPFGLPPETYPLLMLLLLVAGIGSLGVAELVRELDLPVVTVVVAQLVGLTLALVGLRAIIGHDVDFATAFGLLANLWESGGSIAEMISLFGGPAGIVTGPFSLFGVILFLGIPYFLLTIRTAIDDYRPEWAVLCTYVIYFLGMSIIQRRFAGELSLFIVPFVAIGILDLAIRGGILERLPGYRVSITEKIGGFSDDSTVFANIGFGLLIVLIVTSSFVQIPLKINQVVHEEDDYQAAIQMRNHADDVGLTDTENYVFSPWDKSRFFNYLVSGQVFAGTTGEGHGRAIGWVQRHYTPFLASTEEDSWYTLLRSDEAGFVVTHDVVGNYPPDSLHSRLHAAYGSRRGSVPGLAHFRFVYASPDGSTKAFALVEGATIVGNAPNASLVEVSTTIRTESGREITYTRVGQPNQDGVFQVVVANPGRYRVGNQSVVVSEADIYAGSNVTVQDP